MPSALTEPGGSTSRAKAQVASLLRILSAQGDDSAAQGAVADIATGASAAGMASAQPCCPLPSAAGELELERLRRERDAAVQQEQAALRRERDAAVAEGARRGAELKSTARELAALREAHAVATLKAEQAAGAAAAELAGKAAALERALAANAELAAAGAQQQLRIEALETKQAVLLECFQAVEAELLQLRCQRGSGAGGRLAPPLQLLAPPPLAGTFPPAGSNALALTAWAGGNSKCALDEEGAGGGLLVSGSHLALAARCAELQCQLGQQRRQAEAARSAAAAAEEQAAGLRLLLARQAGGAGGGGGNGAAASTAALGQRLEAACEQLEEARRREQALAVAQQEKAQLRRDLQLMLAARGALASLHANLQRAAAPGPASVGA
ncbi:hypothetical protein ABPG75_004777 [Micractinium tetrahymenae]